MIKLINILNEIGDGKIVPDDYEWELYESQTDIKFSVDGYKYEVSFKMYTPDIDFDTGIPSVEFIAIGFDVEGAKKHNLMTNRNHPLKLIASIIGLFEKFIKAYHQKYIKNRNFRNVNKKIFRIKGLVWMGKQEFMDDHRRNALYLVFVEKYLKKRGVRYSIKNEFGSIEMKFKGRGLEFKF